jgi:hypothetical protein
MSCLQVEVGHEFWAAESISRQRSDVQFDFGCLMIKDFCAAVKNRCFVQVPRVSVTFSGSGFVLISNEWGFCY